MAIFQIKSVSELSRDKLAVSGEIKEGEVKKEMWGFVGNAKIKVREIIIFNRKVESAQRGPWCELHITGVTKKEIEGETLIRFEG